MWWKIYFWVFVFINLVGMLMLLPQLPTFNLASYEGVIESALLVLGLYSFLYKKKSLSQEAWKGLFILILGIWIVQLIVYANAIPMITPYLEFVKASYCASYAEAASSIVLCIPALYAIYKIGFGKK